MNVCPPETGIHGHHQHAVDNVEHFTQSLHRCRRIDSHARLHAQAANQLQRPIQMNAGFLMDRHPVCPGVGEGRNIVVSIFDHQMAVEGNVDRLEEAPDHRRSDRNIGHKVAIHHINMEEAGAPRTAALASSAKRAKSADKIDGAISIKTRLLLRVFPKRF